MPTASTTYTTSALALKLIPRVYSTTDLATGDWTTIISEVSRYIDTRVGHIYIPFNSTSDTPATPGIIQKIATNLAAARGIDYLAPGDRNGPMAQLKKKYTDEAVDAPDSWLQQLLSGNDSIPDEEKTSAVLTVGTGGQYDVSTTEAIINVQSLVTSGDIPTILPETVFVTSPASLAQYRYGRDFSIRFEPELQRWVYEDITGLFLIEASPTIKYRWTWNRVTAKKPIGSGWSGLTSGW